MKPLPPTPIPETHVNQGKPPAAIVWTRKLSAWIDGAPIAATKGTLRMEGNTIRHRDSGDRQALRLDSGDVLYRARGVSESANPTNFQVAWDMAEITAGLRDHRGSRILDTSPRQWRYPNKGTYTWDIPKNLHLCTPVPGILLTLSSVRPMSPDLVDLGTLLEWTRVQAIIKSRSKRISKDGKMGYFTRSLANNAQDSDRSYWTVDLFELNKARALFRLDPLPTYESPIDGLAMDDFKNLHALAAS